ncbi:hypothetical protein A3A95_02100 [Candidatus Nomurabacteria bacterium RIFCSPLOWO2_01_FULL_39_18]|uniref:Uncharacterized protein n=1 Tax=Candidatus Nomurabacteria bacterium RIFCSPHIGHO2_01_FULL_40_24b TaxID=1801739 RepID=A0A1F6V9A2_9BACT|nr:MAG: hypothetical protein A2647_00615 [Candidatus Nomurabacteria bacterium RIFCSPHIGHO2_01_FULL_40_24b]OGI90656.1 MAG: hypothetical protein A3A95_02100 [Candidatus Nomurabacteria bacterium RIFCSPLOWO2_01_FULL_39_18]
MSPKTKNIIIFSSIAVIFILIYIFFIREDEPESGLVSSSATTIVSPPPNSVMQNTINESQSSIAKDFLALLLSVKNIRLDDTIFSDKAYNSLRDSSIILIPPGNEGRPNPFAPIGTDSIEAQVINTTTPPPTTPPASATP